MRQNAAAEPCCVGGEPCNVCGGIPFTSVLLTITGINECASQCVLQGIQWCGDAVGFACCPTDPNQARTQCIQYDMQRSRQFSCNQTFSVPCTSSNIDGCVFELVRFGYIVDRIKARCIASQYPLQPYCNAQAPTCGGTTTEEARLALTIRIGVSSAPIVITVSVGTFDEAQQPAFNGNIGYNNGTAAPDFCDNSTVMANQNTSARLCVPFALPQPGPGGSFVVSV